MPITRNAIKKKRQDVKRTSRNKKIKNAVKESIKEFRKKPSQTSIPKLFSVLDRATKHHIYHKNKVARLKSRLTKLLSPRKLDSAERKKTVKVKKQPVKVSPKKK